MTYDVQGQGDSNLFGSDCPRTDSVKTSCTGVPYQQSDNVFQGAEDSLSFFLSDTNPYHRELDPSKAGIAGHSLGAAAVSEIGQCDKRVVAVVAWDNLDPITGGSDVTIPAEDRSDTLPHTPALGLPNDDLFNSQPMTSPPDEHAKMAGFAQLRVAGVDSAQIAFRGATHLTYSSIPLVFQASELNERMASYYTVAWFDRYLKGDPTGYDRLTATTFDDSADTDSIGAGVYDPAKADPNDPYAGNVPYTIQGIKVPDAVSFSYQSAYALHDPRTGAAATCVDIRAGCPATEPATP